MDLFDENIREGLPDALARRRPISEAMPLRGCALVHRPS
jgi:hypothetical protein